MRCCYCLNCFQALNASLEQRGDVVGALQRAAAPLRASCSPDVAARLDSTVTSAGSAWSKSRGRLSQLRERYARAADLWQRYRSAADAVRRFADEADAFAAVSDLATAGHPQTVQVPTFVP